MNNLRESPTYSDSLGESFVRAWRAFRGSTQQMAPPEAVHKIKEKVAHIFNNEDIVDHDWLNRINRLLWVLTGKGVFLLDEKNRETIHKVWQISNNILHERYFPERNPREHAKNEPRNKELDLQEILLQISGRCQLLEDVYQAANNNSKHLVDQLRRELSGTTEEEVRLTKRLQELEGLEPMFRANLELLETKQAEVEEKELLIEELSSKVHQQKEKISTLRKENENLEWRVKKLTEAAIKNDDEIVRLKRKPKEKVITVEEVVTLPPTRTSNRELEELRKENAILKAEQQEVLALNAQLLQRKSEIKTPQEDGSKDELERIMQLFKNARQEYRQNAANPIKLGEILCSLLSSVNL